MVTRPESTGTETGDDSRPLSVPEACEYVWRSALTDSTVGAIGLELESHVVDLDNIVRPVDWGALDPLPAEVRAAAGTSSVSREPGGQLELSGPPHASSAEAITALRADVDRVRAVTAGLGIGLVPAGTDPLRPSYRTNPSGRYRAMEEYFAATDPAGCGVVAMNSTAALQVNLEAGPRRGWAQRVAHAHRLGPVLLAISANSPWLHGRSTGWKSARQRTWLGLDRRRAGPVLDVRSLANATDPAMAAVAFALGAPVMFVATEHDERAVVRHEVTFEQWARGDVLLDRRLPTVLDLDLHLTTLFPPVRLRGYLELRFLDATPQRWWPAVAAVTATLMDDPIAADLAAEATEGTGALWTEAARDGLSDPRLAEATRRCLQIATDRAPVALAAELEELAELADSGRSPGDLLVERIGKVGPRAALAESAREPRERSVLRGTCTPD
ncbi:glutamate-cysteine ligase family protein [Kribbella sp. NPDC048928]|uniref:glutamate-cysteine ligase family protein n=1 Tax=Kribbella sp. NPDC048928 TaxID=3364111 RepID=UPI003717D8CA